MYKISLFFLISLWFISCQAQPQPTTSNVFPVNVPTYKPHEILYCVDNKFNYAHIEFDGEKYTAIDENGNVTVYPVTAKVVQGKCE